MKRVPVGILIALITGTVTAKPAGSLLSAAKFPKTADDLTFAQRTDLLTEGYEPFDTVFENGVCVQNCPYVGITLKEFETRMRTVALQAEQDLAEIADADNTDVPPAQPTSPAIPPSSPILPQQPSGQQTPPQQVQHPTQNGSRIPVGCPLRSNPMVITERCGFIPTRHRNHNGLDLRAGVGTDVFATADGRVVISKMQSGNTGYGNYISIEHDRGYYTVYGHLNQRLVNVGDYVSKGQRIAISGNTGNVVAHLHYEILKGASLVATGATPVNPEIMMRDSCQLEPKPGIATPNPVCGQ